MTTSSLRRLLVPLAAYYSVAFALGYAALNRFDARTIAGLSDTTAYFRMVELDDGAPVPAPFRFRVLVPGLASLVRLGLGDHAIGSWNPAALSMLVVSAAFVTGTAALLSELAREWDARPLVGRLAAFIYLSAFPVVHLQLAGLVDSAEAFFVLGTLLWARKKGGLRLAAFIGIGALAKETTPVFALIGGAIVSRAWAPAEGRRTERWGLALGALLAIALYGGVRRLVGPVPGEGGRGLAFAHANGDLVGAFASLATGLGSSTFLLTFVVFAVLSGPGLRRVPRELLQATATLALVALALSAFAKLGANLVRPLFDVVGPVLAIGGATTLANLDASASSQRTPIE